MINVLLIPNDKIQPIVNFDNMEKNYNRKDNRLHFDLTDGL